MDRTIIKTCGNIVLMGILMLGVFVGCDREPPPPPKPKIVISKKVPPLPPPQGQVVSSVSPADQSKPAVGTQPSEQASPTVASTTPPVPESKPADQAVKTSQGTIPTTTVPAAAPAKPETVVAAAQPQTPVGQTSPEPTKQPETVTKKIETTPAGEMPSPQTKPSEQPQAEAKPEGQLIAGVAQEIIAADKVEGYNPQGKIDPFAPLFKDDETEKKAKAEEEQTPDKKVERPKRERLTPLEKVDLSQLKLVGIVRAPSGNRALVEESSGKGYIITQGTYIGIHYGKVTEILRDRVIVEEEDEDFLGRISLRKRELIIQKPPGEEYHDL